jgi:hypothetical protein
MRERNWPQYNKQLVQRGSLTFLIDPKTLKSLKSKAKRERYGRPIEYSDPLIQLLLLVKIHYRLSYRALQGFAESFFSKLCVDLKIPSYSLICKRTGGLKKSLPRLSTSRPETILIDASGIRVAGEGEWKVKVHGRGRRRKWLKIHLAVNPLNQEIVSEITTTSEVGDSKMTEELMKGAGRSVRKVIADGAYDGLSTRRIIRNKGAYPLIPPPRNARLRKDGEERNDALLEIRGLGGDKQGRRIWGKLKGYNWRVLVETAFSRFKRHYGDRMFSQHPERQLIENHLKCYLLNKMNRIRV